MAQWSTEKNNETQHSLKVEVKISCVLFLSENFTCISGSCGNEILCVFGILNCVIHADTLLIWDTQGSRWHSRKQKLAQEKSNWLKPPKSTTFRIHCASLITRSYIRGFRVVSKYMCENVSRRSRYTQCKL